MAKCLFRAICPCRPRVAPAGRNAPNVLCLVVIDRLKSELERCIRTQTNLEKEYIYITAKLEHYIPAKNNGIRGYMIVTCVHLIQMLYSQERDVISQAMCFNNNVQ